MVLTKDIASLGATPTRRPNQRWSFAAFAPLAGSAILKYGNRVICHGAPLNLVGEPGF